METKRKKLIEFEYKGKHYAIVAPTQEQLPIIDLEYRRAFSQAVREGLMTEFEAKRTFEKNGTWTEKNEKEIIELQMQIVSYELELEKIANEADGRMLSFKIMEARNKLLDLINHKSNLFSAQTVEGYANALRLSAVTYECTVDDKNERVFDNREAFCSCQDIEFAELCYSKAMLVDVGMSDEDINIKFMERAWLEKHGYMNDDSTFTQKYYDELMDSNDNRSTAKATRRKKSKKRKSTKKKAVKKT